MWLLKRSEGGHAECRRSPQDRHGQMPLWRAQCGQRLSADTGHESASWAEYAYSRSGRVAQDLPRDLTQSRVGDHRVVIVCEV